MTDAPMPDTARVRELLAKATPGPWRTHSDETVTVRDARDGGVASMGWLTDRFTGPRRTSAEVHANAALIVELRNAAPALLDALDAAEAARVAAEAERDELQRRRMIPEGERADVLRAAAASANHQVLNLLNHVSAQKGRAGRAEAEVERLTDALQRIAEWSAAYPTKVFPKPDLAQAASVLARAGLSLDIITADAMRHATEGVGEIARAALRTEGEQG